MGRWLTRVLRPLLLLYPPEFRAAYGDEMLRLAVARCARARAHGKAAAAACGVRAAADLAWCGMLERLQGRGRPGPETPEGAGMTSLLRTHLRDATRSLRRQPGFAAAIVLTLALGSGATLALFGIVDAALLRPLPYPDAERLVSIAQRDSRFGLTPFGPPSSTTCVSAPAALTSWPASRRAGR